MRRRTQDQPNTNETAHKKNPALVGLARTRRVTQFHKAKPPSHEEFGTWNRQKSQQRSPTAQTEPRRRCGDLPNSGLVINERLYVPSAPQTRLRTWNYSWWSHGPHESKAWSPATHTRKCSPARSPTARSPGRYHQISPLLAALSWIATNSAKWPLDLQSTAEQPYSGVAIAEHDAQLLADVNRASAGAIPRSIISQYATAWAESSEGALNGHQAWAILCRYRCQSLLAEVQTASTTTGSGRKSRFRWKNSGSAAHWTTEERKPCSCRRKNSVVKEPVPSQSEDQLAKPWKEHRARQNVESTGPRPWFLGALAEVHIPRTWSELKQRAPFGAEAGTRQPQRHERTQAQQDRNHFAPSCQTGTHECSRSHERASKLPSQALDSEDRSSESSTSSQSSGPQKRFQKKVSILPRYAAHVPEERKRLPQKNIDDDEWIRSLTEAKAITADIPEEHITHDQSEVDSKKVRLVQVGESLRKYVSRRLLALSEGEIAAVTPACDKSVLVPWEELKPSPSFIRSSLMNGRQELWTRHWLESKWNNKCFGEIDWCCPRLGKFPSPKTWQVGNTVPYLFVDQDGVQPMPKDRGPEQGDVDCPTECKLAQGMVAAEARLSVAVQQAARTLLSVCTHDSQHERRLHKWYLDDGDVLCHPILVLPYLQAFDTADAQIGASTTSQTWTQLLLSGQSTTFAMSLCSHSSPRKHHCRVPDIEQSGRSTARRRRLRTHICLLHPEKVGSAPQLQAQLSRLRRLKSTAFAKEAWQQVTRTGGSVSYVCLTLVASPLRRVCRQCLNTARLHHQRVRKLCSRSYTDFATAVCVIIPGLSTRAWWNLQHRWTHPRALLAYTPLWEDWDITTEPRGFTETQSRRADFFTTAAVPGRSAAPDVCDIHCSSSPRRCSAGSVLIAKPHITGMKSEAYEPKASSIVLGLDSRRSTTSSTDPNPTVRSVPQRSANVSKRKPTQTETRNSNIHLPTKVSHDTSSPPSHICKRRMVSCLPHRQSHWPLDPSIPARWSRRRRRRHRNRHHNTIWWQRWHRLLRQPANCSHPDLNLVTGELVALLGLPVLRWTGGRWISKGPKKPWLGQRRWVVDWKRRHLFIWTVRTQRGKPCSECYGRRSVSWKDLSLPGRLGTCEGGIELPHRRGYVVPGNAWGLVAGLLLPRGPLSQHESSLLTVDGLWQSRRDVVREFEATSSSCERSVGRKGVGFVSFACSLECLVVSTVWTFCAFFGMRAFLLFDCVPLCFVCSRRSKGGRVPPFGWELATAGRSGFPFLPRGWVNRVQCCGQHWEVGETWMAEQCARLVQRKRWGAGSSWWWLWANWRATWRCRDEVRGRGRTFAISSSQGTIEPQGSHQSRETIT